VVFKNVIKHYLTLWKEEVLLLRIFCPRKSLDSNWNAWAKKTTTTWQSISYPALLISRSSISSGPTSSVPVFLWVTLQHPIACLHLTTPFHTHVSNGFSSKLHTEGHLVTPTRPTPQQTISRVQEWDAKKPERGVLTLNRSQRWEPMKRSNRVVWYYQAQKLHTTAAPFLPVAISSDAAASNTTSSLHCFICKWA